MELFEQMRREYANGVRTVKGVARKFGVDRRMVRQALASAVPPERKPGAAAGNGSNYSLQPPVSSLQPN